MGLAVGILLTAMNPNIVYADPLPEVNAAIIQTQEQETTEDTDSVMEENEDTSADTGLPSGLAKLSSIDPMKFARPFEAMDETADAEAKPLLKDYYDLLSVFAVAGLVFSFIFAGIKLMASGLFSRSCTKEEIAAALGTKIIAFALFCGIVTFTRIISSIVLHFM